MPIQSPLAGNARLAPRDLEKFLGDLKSEPKNVQQGEIQKLLDAGEALLPEGAAPLLKDQLLALQSDAFDPAQGAVKRPQTPSVGEARIEKQRSMDGASVNNHLTLHVEGKAQKGAQFEIVNLSRANSPVIGTGTVGDDGKLAFEQSTASPQFFFGDRIGVRLVGQGNSRSDVAVVTPKQMEVQKWQSGTEKRVEASGLDTQKAMFQPGHVAQDTALPTPKDKTTHMLLVGRAGAAEPFAKLEAVVNGEVQKTAAAADGSFFFDVKGVKPGEALELRVLDEAGQVTTRNYQMPALKLDGQAILNGSQGVPFDRMKDGKPDDKGPFLRFVAEAAVDPFTEVTVRNNSTGAEVSALADANGKIDLELAGVHAGDSLSLVAKDQAGNVAQGAIENWVVPAEGHKNARLSELLCATTMLKPQLDELVGLIQAQPTSVHRALVEEWLAGDGHHAAQSVGGADVVRKALADAYKGANDIVSNAKNPSPKDPIVIGAKVIKPRVMDRGNAAGRDPLEVKGKAEPFAHVEIRNASQPNAPLIGTVQADKDGNFDFLSTDESKFLHGDQLFVRARDQGDAVSGDTNTHSCAYELQVWNATNRTELVELPAATDTRNPFLDPAKLSHQDLLPIAKDGKEQVYQIKGGPLAAEPFSVVRTTTQTGETFEAQVKKDGSFELNVGKVTPGETLSVGAFDANGRTVARNFQTRALAFDSQALIGSSGGVPFQRMKEGKPDKDGPFLNFNAEAAVDPFSWVHVRNNTTGDGFKVQADENGNVDFKLSRVHTGDSLSFSVTDPAGNAAAGAIENYVVPGIGTTHADMEELSCQRTYLPEHVDQLIAIVKADPSAPHRAALETILAGDGEFPDPKQRERLTAFLTETFCGENDVRVHAQNPAPKEPIVIDAEIIKPREMEPRPAPPPARPNRPAPTVWRGPADPLLVHGKAEPFSTVEVRNASQPNAPVIGTVQADKDGNFDVEFTDETRFMHGDQILVRATDQAGASSTDKLAETCQYELRFWYTPPRTETVRMPRDHDHRNPFLDMGKVAAGPVATEKSTREAIYRFTGNALASEPNAIVRVANKTGKHFEAQVKPDGTFKLDVPYEPGETLNVTVFDVNGRTVTRNQATPPLKFDPNAFVNTSEGAPYTRPSSSTDQDQATGRDGPFLRFAQAAAVDPFSIVDIKNNSTGKSFTAQADKDGNLDVEIDGVHVGDSLSFSVKDPAGNKAPEALANYVVPAEPRADARVQDIACQRTVLTTHVDELLGLLQKNPTAANRGAVEAWLNDDHTTFQNPADKPRFEKLFAGLYEGANDVRSERNNPVPKEPIVVDARVIKPRVMDQGNAAGRDPLEVKGRAEPFTNIEIRNASQPNSPVIGTVQTDANGDFNFLSTDESKFLHGDQLLVRAVDQGGGTSKAALTESCGYELQVWNRTNRTELVRLPDATDTRNPFLDAAKIKHEQVIATKDKPKTFTTIAGGPMSAEPNSIVRVQTSKGDVSEAVVKPDGSFSLDVGGYVPGETLSAIATDVNGRTVSRNFATEALKFDPNKLSGSIKGPPFQKIDADGKPGRGGPFLDVHAPEVAFPGAQLEVTNHATGKVESFTADDKGGFAFELSGVHAHDLLSFKVTDAEGNNAPEVLRAFQVPAESNTDVNPVIQALTSQRPVSEDAAGELVKALAQHPTQHHRQLCERLLHEHPTWFMGDAAKTLQAALKSIFKGPPERVPDVTNPRPKMPVVLTSEIIKPRVMDRGNPPQDPLEVTGLGEPLSTVEIYNGSVAGRPLIGTVQVGEDGKFSFTSTDESKFLHGDQIVVGLKDAGGAASDNVVSRGTAFELRVWNSTNRREKVALDKSHDTRDPFVQPNLVKTERAGGTSQSNDSFVLVGQPGAAEVFSTVSVKIGDQTFTTEADINGAFKLPVPGAKVGEAVQIVAGDPNGRQKAVNYTPNV